MTDPRVRRASIDELFSDEKNANKGTKTGKTALAASLKKFGAARSLVIDGQGRVVAGNKTRDALRAAGVEEVLIVESDGKTAVAVQRPDWDLSSDTSLAREYAFADNRVGELDLDWDIELVRDAADDIDLSDWWSDAQLRRLIGVEDVRSGSNSVPDVPAETVTRLGDEWLLGRHRLICASSAEEIARLADVQADCMWTDPPYGVDCGNRPKASKTRQNSVRNDGEDEFRAVVGNTFALASLKPGAPIYVASPIGENLLSFLELFSLHWKLNEVLVWVKDKLSISRLDYHPRHECVIYGHKARLGGRFGRWGDYGWEGDDKQSTVFEFPKPSVSKLHPTQKPVELVTTHLRNSTKIGAIVYEPFAGSGTTLMACEAMDRSCVAVELEPAYCDVIVERWQTETGEKAKRA